MEKQLWVMIQVRIFVLRSTIELVFSWPKKIKTIRLQKQPFPDVLRERCSENMQQVYRITTPMPKCDLICNFIEITLRHGCSPEHLFSEHLFIKAPMEGTSDIAGNGNFKWKIFYENLWQKVLNTLLNSYLDLDSRLLW